MVGYLADAWWLQQSSRCRSRAGAQVGGPSWRIQNLLLPPVHLSPPPHMCGALILKPSASTLMGAST
jgi:hypothetical protein